MSELVMQVRNVSLTYNTRLNLFKSFKHKALDNLSFDLRRGEVLGIIGGNGSGKSTLLQILSGVFQPDTGEVVTSPGTTRSLLTLGLGFNNELSGRDNVILSSMFNGYTKKDAIRAAEGIKEFSGLGRFFEQPVRTYSSGMRSKLGFSAGIVTHVDILMVDEVLAVGDKEFREKAEQAMLEKIGGSGQTVVFVSHSEQQVRRLCDRAIDLSNGGKVIVFDKSVEKKSDKRIEYIPVEATKLLMTRDYDGAFKLVEDNSNLLRNIAMAINEFDVENAYIFMNRASELKPSDEFLKCKVLEYKNKINHRNSKA